jgi:hypothetical protein
MPAPAARSFSARVPCGHSSTAISPLRYCRSSSLLLPRYDRMIRPILPSPVSSARPPAPLPALLETAVRFWSPFLCIACISVSAKLLVLAHSSQSALGMRSQPWPRTSYTTEPEPGTEYDSAVLDVRNGFIGRLEHLGPAARPRGGRRVRRVQSADQRRILFRTRSGPAVGQLERCPHKNAAWSSHGQFPYFSLRKLRFVVVAFQTMISSEGRIGGNRWFYYDVSVATWVCKRFRLRRLNNARQRRPATLLKLACNLQSRF